MEAKKSAKAALEGRRKYFFQIGIVCGLSLALVGFEWAQFELIEHDLPELTVNYTVEDEMPRIKVKKPPKVQLPDPKPKTKVIKPVDKLTEPEPDPLPDPEPEKDPIVLVAMDPDPEPDPEPAVPEIFTIVEDMPSFPGGEAEMYRYLGQNLKYPAIARDAGISGVVYVSFVIDEEGEVNDIKILRGIGGGCEEEAVRVIKNMPKWTPGLQRKVPVKVSMNMPVHFQLK